MDHLGAFGGGTGQGVGRPTVASSRQDEQERGIPALRQELPERGERRRVGPVEILDRDDERTAFDERKDEPAERVEHPQLQGLRRLLADLAVDRAEHRLQVRHGVVEIAGEQRPYPLGHHRRRDRLTLRELQRVQDQVSEREVRRGPAERHAATLEPRDRRARDVTAQLLDQPALADAGVPEDDEEPALAGERAVGGRRGAFELELAADHRGRSRCGRRIAPLADHLERRDRLGLALQLEPLLLPPREPVAGRPARHVADEDASGRRVRLQAGGGVQRVAGRAVLDPPSAADRPEHHQPGLDADPDLERWASVIGPLDDAERGADRALGIVLVRHRRAEQREDPVAGEVLDRAAERLDRIHHPPNGAAEHLARVFGVHPLRELRRPDDVGEQGGHDLAFFAHLAAHRPILLASRGGNPQEPGARARRRGDRLEWTTRRKRYQRGRWKG